MDRPANEPQCKRRLVDRVALERQAQHQQLLRRQLRSLGGDPLDPSTLTCRGAGVRSRRASELYADVLCIHAGHAVLAIRRQAITPGRNPSAKTAVSMSVAAASGQPSARTHTRRPADAGAARVPPSPLPLGGGPQIPR